VQAQEDVKTAAEVAGAERARQVAVLRAQQEAEVEATGIKVAAEAEKQAADDRSEAIRIEARAEADKVTLAADAEKSRLLAEAEGKKALYAAENTLSAEIIRLRLTEQQLDVLPEVMRAAVEPAKQISNISVVDFGGMGRVNGGPAALLDGATGGQGGGQGGGGSNGGGSVGDGILKLLLGYQMYKPLVDKMLTDAGIGDLGDLATRLQSLSSSDAPDIADPLLDRPKAKPAPETGAKEPEDAPEASAPAKAPTGKTSGKTAAPATAARPAAKSETPDFDPLRAALDSGEPVKKQPDTRQSKPAPKQAHTPAAKAPRPHVKARQDAPAPLYPWGPPRNGGGSRN